MLPLQQPVFAQLSQVGNTPPPPPVSSDKEPMLLSSGKSELSLSTGEMGEMGSPPAGQLEVRIDRVTVHCSPKTVQKHNGDIEKRCASSLLVQEQTFTTSIKSLNLCALMSGSMVVDLPDPNLLGYRLRIMSMPDELSQRIVRECLSIPKSSDVGLVLMLLCVCKSSRREVFEILERAFQILTDGTLDRSKHPGFKKRKIKAPVCKAAKQATNRPEWQAYVEKNRQKLERVFACSLLA